MRCKALICTVCLFVMTSLWVSNECPAQADGRGGFALSMDSQTLRGRPGETVNGSLTIVTYGLTRASRYEIRNLDLGQTGAGVLHPVDRGEGARSCADWIQIIDRVEIPPETSRTVPFSITIPEDTFGGYYGYIQVRLLPELPEERMVILIQPALAVKVELEVPGGRRKIELGVKELQFIQDEESSTSGIAAEIENLGNLKASVEGDILLYKSRDTYPYRVQLPFDSGGQPYVLYPGLSQRLRCGFITSPPPGNYSAEVRLKMAGTWRTRSTFDITIPRPGSEAAPSSEAKSQSEFDIDFNVDPDFVEVMVPSGATRTVSIRVQNRDDVEVNATASVMSAVPEINGFFTYSEIENPEERWVTVSPSEFILKPRSTRSVLLKITAPEYHTGLDENCAVRIIGTAGVDETGWISEADLGVPVVAVPPGASPPNISIEKLEALRTSPERNPTVAILVIQNTGGRTANITGKLWLERALTGEAIQTMPLADVQEILLLPGTVREFRMPISYLDIDEFRLKTEVSIIKKPATKQEAEITFDCTQGPGGE